MKDVWIAMIRFGLCIGLFTQCGADSLVWLDPIANELCLWFPLDIDMINHSSVAIFKGHTLGGCLSL